MNKAQHPNQSRLWNAYGHAMGAVQGLELVIRTCNHTTGFFNLNSILPNQKNYLNAFQKLNENADNGTFGQNSIKFKQLHPSYITSLLSEALDNAVDFRNSLSHRFLYGNLGLMQTERGIDLIASECAMYQDHFQRIEKHIRSLDIVDWELFAHSITIDDATLKRHPLYNELFDD